MMDLDIPERLVPVRDKIDVFVRSKVDPLTEEFLGQTGADGDRWALSARQTEIMDGLKAEAKSAGLWNFFLPESQGGAGVTNLEYAHLAEVMARNPIASEVFNCAAPDTGNMEVLERYGTEAQKKEWLEPLLEGKIRSAFAMTEPDVASSDATNIATSAVLDGDEWLINGSKHYISGAGDSRCKIMITMVVTNPDAPKHLRQSQILVPIDAKGVTVVRPMYVFGKDDAPHGHMHITFENVRVPKENIILGEGRGFEISQGRLGPGRIHHCMRSIGVAERVIKNHDVEGFANGVSLMQIAQRMARTIGAVDIDTPGTHLLLEDLAIADVAINQQNSRAGECSARFVSFSDAFGGDFAQWQSEPESRTDLRFTVDRYRSAHQLHEATADREAQTRPAKFACRGTVCLLERFEDMALVLRFNADA